MDSAKDVEAWAWERVRRDFEVNGSPLTGSHPLLTRCALFLVLKGELELARGDIDLCQSDLQQVLFLLESSTGKLPSSLPNLVGRVHITAFTIYGKVWMHSSQTGFLVLHNTDFSSTITVCVVSPPPPPTPSALPSPQWSPKPPVVPPPEQICTG
jgi:hypothetical protein